MPISLEQFYHLDNYSDLLNLHVYGDLLKLYALPIHTSIANAGRIRDEISLLDAEIFTLYVSYVLSKIGFNVQLFIEEDFTESGDELYTTKFNDEDWLENLYLFEAWVEDRVYEWSLYYQNFEGEIIKIIFATMFISEFDANTGKTYNEAECFARKFDESASNYVIAHPRLSRQAKKTFHKVKREMKNIIGNDVVISTGEFINNFIKDKQRRFIIENNWSNLLNNILKKLQKKWPIIVLALNEQQIMDVRERLQKLRIKFEIGELEDAIKDAGVACESILQILNSVYGSIKPDIDVTFYDLLNNLRDFIEEEFGKNVYNDLDFIRIWRNNVVHPKAIKPNIETAYQVITRANLFFKLFEMRIMKKYNS